MVDQRAAERFSVARGFIAWVSENSFAFRWAPTINHEPATANGGIWDHAEARTRRRVAHSHSPPASAPSISASHTRAWKVPLAKP